MDFPVQTPPDRLVGREDPVASGHRQSWVERPVTGRLPELSSGRRADLIEERERACLTLEHVADEVTQRRLDLALDTGREPKAGQRLDVQALVCLE
jgi:hypothetical protein